MNPGYFVTGTDTEVGKTLATCAVIWALRQRAHASGEPLCVLGMKAVAAGTETDAQGRVFNSDVRALQHASSRQAPEEWVCPYVMAAPLSPHLAAQREGLTIELERIVQAHRQLSALADRVVVEGAGGFCVPLTMHANGADLARALGLPVILVVGMRLGCLNHAMLTAQAIAAKGLSLAGWIANCITPDMPALEDNIAYLQTQLMQQHGAPLLGRLPYQATVDVDSARALARHLSLP